MQPCGNRVSSHSQRNIFSMSQYDSFSNSFCNSYGYYNNADYYLQTDNSGWWEHSNFNCRREHENFQQFQPELVISPQHDFEDIIQSLEDVVQQFQKTKEVSLQDISNQIN